MYVIMTQRSPAFAFIFKKCSVHHIYVLASDALVYCATVVVSLFVFVLHNITRELALDRVHNLRQPLGDRLQYVFALFDFGH